jgi:hypothetical protein
MANANNTIILNGCINQFKNDNELKLEDSEVFEVFTTTQLTKHLDLSSDEIEESIVDGGNDGGLDSFLILFDERAVGSEDDLENSNIRSTSILDVSMIQSKTEKSLTETTLDKLLVSAPVVFDLELSEQALLIRFNPSLVQRIITFRAAWQAAVRKNAKMKISYYYACQANEVQTSPAFDKKVEQLIALTQERVTGAEVFYKSLSAKELLDLYNKTKSAKIDLRFKETPISVSFAADCIGYLGVVELPEYFRFLVDEDGELRENIFESNIRHYQGDVDVNQKIQETLRSDHKRDFWWLNNGITVIASNVGQIGKTLTLENVQVVNGLQTSYTIGKHYEKMSNDARSILVKVIITDDKEAIDHIISATNRQNPVSPTLLRATDDTQRSIELFFLNKGFFYDRRKNFYKNQSKPSSKIFSIQFTAQAIEAIANRSPATARSKPTTLIKEDKSYNNIFDANVNFAVYLNCCLVTQKVGDFIRSVLSANDKPVGRNFKYHLSRIVVSLLTNKAYYTNGDLEVIAIDKIDDAFITKSYNLLDQMIKEYQNQNPTENIINIAKSNKFVDALNKKLQAVFP